jgi:capsular polysaccharide export protein
LTRDRQICPRRTRKRTLVELFAAAYLLYPRYLDPVSGGIGTLEQVIDHLLLQRNAYQTDAGHLVCTGFRWWKRPYIRRALKKQGNRVSFSDDSKSLDGADKLVVWGAGDSSAMVHEAEKRRIPIHRMEDGFLRSVGLGSNLVRPLSLVVDTRGIYFDPTRPSDLEMLLLQTDFTPELCRRGAELRKRIVSERLSKYNVGSDDPLLLAAEPGQRTILVPGQVEDDASIRLGCIDLRTNLELLQEVRRQNPEAYIIYKPHPDVMAGNRKGDIAAAEALRHCDLVVTDRAMPACLAAVEEVHTLTSLTGFEALVHGKAVSTYGLPFYSGWGLTRDRHEISRRGRKLDVEALIVASLILYPRYIDWEKRTLISPEDALEGLARLKTSQKTSNEILGRWQRKLSGFFDGVLK